MWQFTCVATLLIVATCACSNSSAPNDISKEATSPQKLYEQGVKDYLDNNFEGCLVNLERAIGMFNSYMGKLRRCHLQCNDEVSFTEPLDSADIENLLFYEKAIKNTLCLLKCKKREAILDALHMEDATVQTFAKMKPYEYLQACYAHVDQYQKAANAAFTYLVVNPNDSGVVMSLQHYTQQPNVDINSIVNHEAKDYVYLYIHGTQAYEKKLWDEVIQNMEASLDSFLQEEEECRAQCEGPFAQPDLDFIPSIANHFTHVLLCKRKCIDRLSTLNGEKHDDLLPSHYHYLQYAYFKVGKLKEACRAVASYMLFYPGDKTMLHNVEYYKTLPKVKHDYFEPRSEAINYTHRYTYETKIVDYVTEVFGAETAKLYDSGNENEVTGDQIEETTNGSSDAK